MDELNQLKIKRAYLGADGNDGFRILVDRIWPRGVQKEALKADLWAKNITPSTEARKAFDHQADRFADFTTVYRHELDQNAEAPAFLDLIREKLRQGPVTLIYGAKSETINHAVVLRQWLLEHMKKAL